MTEGEAILTIPLTPQNRRALTIIAAYTGETHDQIIKRLLFPEAELLQQEINLILRIDKENK